MATLDHLPEIVRIQRAGGNNLSRIHHAASPDGDQHIYAMFLAELDPRTWLIMGFAVMA